MSELILIKLGGSIITDKSIEFKARADNMIRFAKEITSALKIYKGKIIIGHGAGSFAHTPAKKYQTKGGLINEKSLYGMSVVEHAARQLNLMVVESFLRQKLPVFSLSPASFLLSSAQRYTSGYLDSLRQALEIGQIPVVYGDVIVDKKQGCTIFSTEKVFGILVKELHKKYKIKMIYVTDVDGVYDASKITIPVINPRNFRKIKKDILGASTVDVTGGMLHKVEEALKIVKKYNISTQIVNGTIKGVTKGAVLNKKHFGTVIKT